MFQHLKVFFVVLVWMMVFAFYHHTKSVRSVHEVKQQKSGTSSVVSSTVSITTTVPPPATTSILSNQPSTTPQTATTNLPAVNSNLAYRQSSEFPPIGQLLGPQTSRHAYVTLIHGIDNTFSYRGYLYDCLIMRHVLQRLGSTADFIALVGFTSGK